MSEPHLLVTSVQMVTLRGFGVREGTRRACLRQHQVLEGTGGLEPRGRRARVTVCLSAGEGGLEVRGHGHRPHLPLGVHHRLPAGDRGPLPATLAGRHDIAGRGRAPAGPPRRLRTARPGSVPGRLGLLHSVGSRHSPNRPPIFCGLQDGLGKGHWPWGSWLSPAETCGGAAGPERAAGKRLFLSGGWGHSPHLIKVYLEHGDTLGSCPGHASDPSASSPAVPPVPGPRLPAPPSPTCPWSLWDRGRLLRWARLDLTEAGQQTLKSHLRGWVQAGIFLSRFILGKLVSGQVSCLRGFEEWCWAGACMKGSLGMVPHGEGTLHPRECGRLPSWGPGVLGKHLQGPSDAARVPVGTGSLGRPWGSV